MPSCSEVDAWSRRHEAHVQRGQVTSSCLWNACRAMVLGVLLVAAGAAMAALGYYNQQPVRSAAFAPPAPDSGLSVQQRPEAGAGGPYRHLSYFGSVIMGIGGFIVVASCVMTFEVRDSASKIVPARFRGQPATTTSGDSLAQRSSASQTLPWHLQPAAAMTLSRSVSAPCVRGPLPPLPPEQQDTAPAAGHRKTSPSGSGDGGTPRNHQAMSVGRLFRKHSMTVLYALRAGANRTRTPPLTSSGDQVNYDNRLGRQGGNNGTSLVDGVATGQRCSPNGGYHAFNGHRPAADNQMPAMGLKRSLSGDRRFSESVWKNVNTGARRREVLVHIEQSSGDEVLTVSHVAPVNSVSMKEESEQEQATPDCQTLLPNRPASRPRPQQTAVVASPLESAIDDIVTNGDEHARNPTRAPDLHIDAKRSSEELALEDDATSVPTVAADPATKVVNGTPGIAARVPPLHPERGYSRSPPSPSSTQHCVPRLPLVPDTAVVAVTSENDTTVGQSRDVLRDQPCLDTDSGQGDLGEAARRQRDFGESAGSPVDGIRDLEDGICQKDGPVMRVEERETNGSSGPKQSEASSGAVQRQDSVTIPLRPCPEPLQGFAS